MPNGERIIRFRRISVENDRVSLSYHYYNIRVYVYYTVYYMYYYYVRTITTIENAETSRTVRLDIAVTAVDCTCGRHISTDNGFT